MSVVELLVVGMLLMIVGVVVDFIQRKKGRQKVSEQGRASFSEVFEAVRRIIERKGERFPGEALVSYTRGALEVSRTAADEYEVRHEGAVVFRAGVTGGLSGAHAFRPGGWIAEVMIIRGEAAWHQ